ncbi:MAG TPA: succinate dehydrogenase cytochrome b subunit [Ilumatobacteraceae bacterium]|nr:succinate dehydrogenase cytochrome b subunit [Ilumatobacteraceae bacterium]
MAQAVQTRGPVSGTAATPKRRRRFFLTDLYATSVGKKYVMAITGIAMIGFVIVHMIGNLKMYLGQGDFDHYAEFLRELLVPIFPRTVVLWLLRMGLIVALLLHLHAAYGLTVMNRRARSVKYQSPRDYQVANFASRTMRWTGIIVFLFLIFHLADFTWGFANDVGVSSGDGEFTRGEAYANVVRSFERVPVAVLYIVANIALGIHLFHGTWSLFQSMGWNNPRFKQWRRHIAVLVATVIVVGNVSFPVAVLAGIVGE